MPFFIKKNFKTSDGFTLIELLVVIAIISILSVVVVMTLNPAELLRQARDSTRVSDMDTFTRAVSTYQVDQGTSLGNASIVYISLPDPTISGVQTSTCTYWGLPSFSASMGYSYQCSSPQNYRNINGTGWVPINFSNASMGSALSNLPVDPINSSSTGLYYTYSANGGQYEITSFFESQKNKTKYGQDYIIPYYPEVNAKGSSMAVSPLFNAAGLVGYWPMDEGTGSIAIDATGGGKTGFWSGTLSGINNTYYQGGKVGPYSGYFNGINNIVVTTSSVSMGSSGTIVAWVSADAGTMPPSTWPDIAGYYSTGNEPMLIIAGNTAYPYIQFIYLGNYYVAQSTVSIASSNWYQIAGTYEQSGSNTIFKIYLNGVQTDSRIPMVTVTPGSAPFTMDKWNWFQGRIDDVRVYNRVLSAAEIFALYQAQK
jgi:prepilin-type N-terminal cleavage/methylation domain-containing protein